VTGKIKLVSVNEPHHIPPPGVEVVKEAVTYFPKEEVDHLLSLSL